MKERSTSIDIAHRAGVSQSTVSRALRDSPLVNPETKNKIKEIAKQLNYKVDKNASNLRSQLSGTIALLLFEEHTDDESHMNLFFLSMLGSVTRACAANGYDLLVSFQQLSDDWHADYEDCHKADGIILLGYGDYTDYKEKLLKLEKQGTHFVRWGDAKEDQPGLSIGCNNVQGGYDITLHLINLGRKNIAFIGHVSKASPEFRDRYKGCVKAITEQLEVEVNHKLQFDAIATEQSGYLATQQLITSGEKFDAIFCACDLIAIGAMKALRENNFSIPEDISIVGFDDIPLANFTRPALTTVQQDTLLAGNLLVDSILSLIRNESVKTTMLPSKLIIRDSCGYR
ncbi:MAG TPA: LacI family transcriptional regulator [Aeromonadales bacterium]|nr:LacI family transcriptional regulator [Aeromonadales bacterium]